MIKNFILPPLLVLSFVASLYVGEILAGTSLYFASMMALAVLSACVTYNILGGLGTISGIAFTRFALTTLVISQVGKVLLFERADINLDVPELTITVYAVYFGFLMLGTFVFSRVRLTLPKPTESETPAQLRYLYLVALSGGLLGTAWLLILEFAGGNADASLGHGFARALSFLLPFSLVLAVDNRIRTSSGQHSLGWMAVWPAIALAFHGFLYGARLGFVEPFAIIFLTCYLRKFRFRLKHTVAAISIAVLFFVVVSPFYLYSRSFGGKASITEQLTTMFKLLESAPSQWETIKSTVGEGALAAPGSVNYFASANAVTMNRFALIGPDSTLINACATGFHYGFTSIRLDVLTEIPRFLYRDKPEIGSNKYLGHLDGQEGDAFETTNSTVTSISDSYGAFSWLGVAAFAFVVMPAIFVVYESMFEIQRPWGTVAAVLLFLQLMEGSMGHDITEVLIKNPLYIVILSWCAAWIVRLIPVTGDRAVKVRNSSRRSVMMGTGDD
ncbi:MAG TPA: hypothetical protein VHZ25_14360 [Acidobacteriaceae bacterium]|jgi:hypothetical protein|nr:hypothetical protein [Acidobacteriaceae bacterium]